MDPSFFGLDRQPFGNCEAAGEPFLSDAHAALTTELHAGLKAPHGITLLIGDEGAGKTTFVRSFASRLSDSSTVAFLPSTGPGLRHLLTEVIEQLGGASTPSGDEQSLLDKLNSLARARAEHDRATLVILDDAHELPAKTIERLGRLFGDDPAEPSMLHVVLVGRPELLDRMNAANDRSILKHLIQVCRMDPIGPEESFQYIADRIQKVGGVVDRIFTEDALRLIVKRAEGLPAKIDMICQAALKQAEDRGEESVGAEAVDLACMGVEGFVVEESAVREQEVEPSSYVFTDDQFEQDEALGSGRGDSTGQRRAPRTGVASRAAESHGNRKRLILWAFAAVAVAGGFAATMTGTGEDPAVPDSLTVAALEADQGAAPPAVAAGSVEAAVDPAEPAILPADPVSVPKLVIKRGAGGKRKVDVAGRARGKKNGGQEGKSGSGGNARRSAPLVHAAPRPVPTGPATRSVPAAVTTASAARSSGAGASQPAASAQVAKAVPAVVTTTPVVAAPASRPASPTRAAASALPSRQERSAVASAAPTRAAAVVATPRPLQPVAQSPAAGRVEAAAVAPGSPAAAAQRATPVVSAAQPIAPAVVAKPPALQPRVVPKRPAPAPVAAAKPIVPTTVRYTVQVGAYSLRANAETMLAKVRGRYPDGRIVVASAAGKPVFRVVSGAFSSKASADIRASALKQGGYSTYVRRLAD